MNKLIVLIGEAGSGKTAIARELQRYDERNHISAIEDFFLARREGGSNSSNSTIVSFATPIRDMFYALGLTEQHLKGDLKEVPCDILSGVTPRIALQTLGTEWARDTMHKDFWVNIWKSKVQGYIDKGFPVITDDCRFPNEELAVKEFDGIIIRLHRNIRKIETSSHASESYIAKIKEDFNVDNNRPVLEVVQDILECINKDNK